MTDETLNTDTTDSNDPAAGSAEIENLRAEKAALFEKLARAQADFQNARKRLEADLETRVQYQLSKIIEGQLPLIDNLERAIGVDPAKVDAANVLKGVGLVHDQWLELLKKFGVETIQPKAGEPFDPHLQQAVMHEPSTTVPPGSVTRVAQTGYSLNGKLVRSASSWSRKSKSMPTYEYVCEACGVEFEKFQSIKADPIKVCPECGKEQVRRKISTGAGILFKGGGFYETDYRSAGYNEAKKKDSGDAPKSDAKPADAPAAKSEPAKAEAKPAAESKPAAAPKTD